MTMVTKQFTWELCTGNRKKETTNFKPFLIAQHIFNKPFSYVQIKLFIEEKSTEIFWNSKCLCAMNFFSLLSTSKQRHCHVDINLFVRYCYNVSDSTFRWSGKKNHTHTPKTTKNKRTKQTNKNTQRSWETGPDMSVEENRKDFPSIPITWPCAPCSRREEFYHKALASHYSFLPIRKGNEHNWDYGSAVKLSLHIDESGINVLSSS